MAKHVLHHAVFVQVEIDLPETCPHCTADLSEGGSVNEWNWVDSGVKSHVVHGIPVERDERLRMTEEATETHLEPEGYTAVGDDYRPSAIWCTHCDTPIFECANIVLQADNPRAKPVLDAVDLES